MKCIYCNQDVPDKARFCPLCNRQIKCKECDEVLYPDSKICISCGQSVVETDGSMNTIEFSESKNARSFKANFSDTVGESIAGALGLILNDKMSSHSKRQHLLGSVPQAVSSSSIEITDTIATEVIDNDLVAMNKIFKNNNGAITLKETRLKATSKRDAYIRLTLLFVYYQELSGRDEILRSDLTSIMNDASLNDSNWRTWLVKNNLVGVKDNKVEIKAPGREKAKEIMAEVLNSEIEDKWRLGTTGKSLKRAKKKEDNGDND